MPRKLTLNDLWTLKTLGKIALSPDGRRVAFEVHTSVRDKNENSSAIWLLHLNEQGHAEAPPHQLTSGSKNDTNPVWAPDSRRLLFLSNREGEKSQLWLIDSEGGEARKLTSMQHGVSEAAWSPDGNWIALTAPAASTDDEEVLVGGKTLDEAARKQTEEDERFGLRTVSTAFYRLDGRGLYERFAHLFVMPAPPGGVRQVLSIPRRSVVSPLVILIMSCRNGLLIVARLASCAIAMRIVTPALAAGISGRLTSRRARHAVSRTERWRLSAMRGRPMEILRWWWERMIRWSIPVASLAFIWLPVEETKVSAWSSWLLIWITPRRPGPAPLIFWACISHSGVMMDSRSISWSPSVAVSMSIAWTCRGEQGRV